MKRIPSLIFKNMKWIFISEKTTKHIRETRKTLLLLIISFSLHAYGLAQSRSLYYDVEKNGKVIGHVNVFEKSEGNKTVFTLSSNVKTSLIISYSNYIKESVVFEKGMMTSSNYYQKVNGKETATSIYLDGTYFKKVSDGRVDFHVHTPVYNNYLQMFFYYPGDVQRVYSNRFQRFLDVKKITETRYRLTLPNRDYNYYDYKNGICTSVDIERAFFTIHFVLKKIEN